MNSARQYDDHQALAYPEPPPHPMWHRYDPRPRQLTPEEQQRHTEDLLRALHTPRPRSPRTHQTLAEAS
ncbi:hypothetical protein [Streptomyces sp. NPDC058279]|uniref:hypothetical protein n=1 Tax=Streptomyces sp. NPDC058279 TaxID=3346418 RepID=UPI0036EAC7FA